MSESSGCIARCTTGADVGMPEYEHLIESADPFCPIHGVRPAKPGSMHEVVGALGVWEFKEEERWLLRCRGCGWRAFTQTANPDEADPLIDAHLIEVTHG